MATNPLKKPASKRVIAWECLPARIPLWPSLTLWLVLDRLQAPGWVWGASGLLLVIVWAGWIHQQITAQKVDVLENRTL